ncbi:unnamed protein product [Lepeophtheirus salmonis]|uniref:(salmon louse) hypothetical protein n=1 Tax=Lepeophtheirus salmonis TaxID=72036 RepID=A0A7R8CYV4_LEPSM|nr:unnamed protein product [Lepeophtheirus salmonis]CAF2972009.1 unnamed protein product [Lepeophtheirus salmonis]
MSDDVIIRTIAKPKADIGDLEGSTMTRQKRQISPQGHFKGSTPTSTSTTSDLDRFFTMSESGLLRRQRRPLQQLFLHAEDVFVTTTTLPPCPRTSNPIPSRDYRQSFRESISTKSQEASFTIQLPDEAFISNLSMILSNGEEFVSNVKEKDKKVRFIITYEELLPRTQYTTNMELILDTRGYIIPEYTITVNINESLPISYLNVPEILNQNNLVDYAKGSKFLSKNEEAVVKRNVDDDPSKAIFS